MLSSGGHQRYNKLHYSTLFSCVFTAPTPHLYKTTAPMLCHTWCTYLSFQQLPSCHVQYDCHSITSSKLLKEAVKESSYPPSITCVVMYNEELRSVGRPTEVELHISGMDPEMVFQCTAYERIQGDWSRHSDCPSMVIL